MSDAQLPQQKKPKLVIAEEFDRGEDGELVLADGPSQERNEECAVCLARKLAENRAGAIAWSRGVNPAIGGYGQPKILE